jgi:hypothetical protein
MPCSFQRRMVSLQSPNSILFIRIAPQRHASFALAAFSQFFPIGA